MLNVLCLRAAQGTPNAFSFLARQLIFALACCCRSKAVEGRGAVFLAVMRGRSSEGVRSPGVLFLH